MPFWRIYSRYVGEYYGIPDLNGSLDFFFFFFILSKCNRSIRYRISRVKLFLVLKKKCWVIEYSKGDISFREYVKLLLIFAIIFFLNEAELVYTISQISRSFLQETKAIVLINSMVK